MNRKQFLKSMLGLAIGANTVFGTVAQAADTIKVGILHSLSGTMAISETALKNTALMMMVAMNPMSPS